MDSPNNGRRGRTTPMVGQQKLRLEHLFEAAMSLESHEIPAFLDRACGEDRALRRELEGLLAADKERSPVDELSTLVDERPAPNLRVVPPAVPQRVTQDEPGPKAGDRILQYELIRKLGRGGMGTVFLSRDIRLGRRVAIKFLHAEKGRLTERFLVEARLTARCNHENIVVIHEIAVFDGTPFMVLEYLRGHTLRDVIRGKALPVGRAVELILPVVKALHCAHEQGIIHRDLKPENIFVADSGTVKVLDFGIAKVLSRKRAHAIEKLHRSTADSLVLDNRPITHEGALMGTMPYMAPEQWVGNIDAIDARTDIWALGVMLYEMVTGRHPLAPLRGTQLAIVGLMNQSMPSVQARGPDIPPELAALIDHCLLKPMELRPGNADELLSVLEPLLPGQNGGELQTDECPYPGLTAFQESDASRFFGRSRDIAYMLARIREQPLMGVVGPSGVGKSSFIRAGVVPALKHTGEPWESFIIRPGRQPLWALASALMPLIAGGPVSADHYEVHALVGRFLVEPGYAGTMIRNWSRANKKRVLVFVDQFEELFTLVPDARERLTFTNCLLAIADDATSPLRVVISVRSDFVDRIAENRQFMMDLTPGLVFLPPPDREGLREALTQPAEMLGYRFEAAGMVEHMLDTLETTAGSLPLLQFTASKLWDARDVRDKLLTDKSYRAIGGISGALASHADRVMAGLSPQAQLVARAVLQRLITVERTRALASVDELCELSQRPEEVRYVVDHLVDARLLVVHSSEDAGGTIVEIVHESLIDSWPLLRRWLDEDQENALFLEQLRNAARQWQAKGRPQGLLWRGDAMDDAQRWYQRFRGKLPTLEYQYLQAVFSLAARSVRRKRLLVSGTIIFLSTLVAAAAVALVMIRDAQQEAELRLRQWKGEQERADALDGIAKDRKKKLAQTDEDLRTTKKQVTHKEQQLKHALDAKSKALEQVQREATRAQQAEKQLKNELEKKQKVLERYRRLFGPVEPAEPPPESH